MSIGSTEKHETDAATHQHSGTHVLQKDGTVLAKILLLNGKERNNSLRLMPRPCSGVDEEALCERIEALARDLQVFPAFVPVVSYSR